MFVERSRVTLEQMLSRSDPWGGDGCSRIDCFQCQQGGGNGGNARKKTFYMKSLVLSASKRGRSPHTRGKVPGQGTGGEATTFETSSIKGKESPYGNIPVKFMGEN